MKPIFYSYPLLILLLGGVAILLGAPVGFAQNAQTVDASAEGAGSASVENEEPAQITDEGMRLNFRGVPLTTVLDYLSKAAGFVIVLDADISGQVDVWSHQPLSKDEAVDLLNTVLNQKGYAAIRNGRTLTIVDQDVAKQRDLPVKVGGDPQEIPKNDEMITQIIPLRYTDAVELIENLSPLIPSYASISANESSNAIVLVDTQTNIRRVAEIVRALDTSISSISTIRVFPLDYSVATEVATMVNEIFKVESEDRNNRRERFFGRRGGFPGGDEERQEESEARRAASRVVAVADEGTNSLVVAAPEDLMGTIEKLVEDIDKTPTSGVTTVQVFPLVYADASEVADMINEIFEIDTDQQNASGRGGFFGRGGGPPRGRDSEQTESRSRQAATRVVAVANEGTNSVVISAAEEFVAVIAQLIKDIDKDLEDLTDIRVFPLKHADAQEMAEIITELFGEQGQSAQTQERPQFMRGLPGMRGASSNQQQQTASDRKKMQYTVEVTADRRTNSVVVVAGHVLLEQIGKMIEDLDSDPAKDQKVFVYKLQNADVENVAAVLRSMFQEQTIGTRTTATGQSRNNLNEFTSTIMEDVQATSRSGQR